MAELDRVTLHGQELAYRYVPGQGPTRFLVHGVGGNAARWDPVTDLLVAKGQSVLVVDLPGHGSSSKARGDYSLGALACSLRDLLDHLEVERAVLVGHSLGGGISMQFTYQFPQRVDGLVLVSSGGLGDETSAFLRAATLPGAEVVLPLVSHRRALVAMSNLGRALAAIGIRPEGLSEDAMRTLEGLHDPESRAAFLATLRGVVDVRGQRVSAVSRLSAAADVPTLLIWGDRDAIIPMSHGERAHEVLPASRLVIFPGAGHEPHRFDPERFANLLTDELPVRRRVGRPRRGTTARAVHESAR